MLRKAKPDTQKKFLLARSHFFFFFFFFFLPPHKHLKTTLTRGQKEPKQISYSETEQSNYEEKRNGKKKKNNNNKQSNVRAIKRKKANLEQKSCCETFFILFSY